MYLRNLIKSIHCSMHSYGIDALLPEGMNDKRDNIKCEEWLIGQSIQVHLYWINVWISISQGSFSHRMSLGVSVTCWSHLICMLGIAGLFRVSL